MAKKSLVVKASRKPKYKVRGYTRCQRCGRARAYYLRAAYNAAIFGSLSLKPFDQISSEEWDKVM